MKRTMESMKRIKEGPWLRLCKLMAIPKLALASFNASKLHHASFMVSLLLCVGIILSVARLYGCFETVEPLRHFVHCNCD